MTFKQKLILLSAPMFLMLTAFSCTPSDTEQSKEQERVNAQQSQYAIGQPVPVYDWSLERDLLIKLYNIRNDRVATHSVWRSNSGIIEDDCPSLGYGIPYDTSLTNPLMATAQRSYNRSSITSVGQAEPNGVFASTNTSATWVMCANSLGQIEPHYVEAKVTVYPYSVSVDYDSNRVLRVGEDSVTIESSR